MIVFLRGPIRTGSITTVTRNSEFLLSDIIELGNITNTKMNLEKCIGPGRKMEILGWSSILSKEVLVIPPKKKNKKYCKRLRALRKRGSSSSKFVGKIVGCLVFAAWVTPCGRPVISHISKFIVVDSPLSLVTLDSYGQMACEIWMLLLKKIWTSPTFLF